MFAYTCNFKYRLSISPEVLDTDLQGRTGLDETCPGGIESFHTHTTKSLELWTNKQV